MNDHVPSSQDPFSLPTPKNRSTSPSVSGTTMPSAQLPITPPNQSGIASGVASSDVIEPEWLDRTQHVMRNFATDPYQLSKEFGALRTEYIKHRYGKILKNSKSEQDT